MMEPYHWTHRTLMSWAWLPFSWIYYALVSLRLSLVKPNIADIPIICIGNNTAGGAGKTPTAIAVAHWLKEIGYHPAFVSRGYKGHYVGAVEVDAAIHSAYEVGDEPLLLSRHAPCVVAKKRLMAVRKAQQLGANVLIMDDGLQNPSLVKDMVMMVVDGAYGFGSRFMMPAGPCREPIARSMKKADAVLIIGEKINPHIDSYIPKNLPVFSAMVKASEDLSGQKFHPFSGIAYPDKFVRTVKEQGGDVVRSSSFPDHHHYTQKELERLQREAEEDGATLITTEKDAVKLPPEFLVQVKVLPIELHCERQPELIALIEAQIKGQA